MQSEKGIIYHEPPKPLWVPRPFATRPTSVGVMFKTEICDCDAAGNVIAARVTHQGRNTITDWGMDSLDLISPGTLTSYCHLGSVLGTAKRVLTGGITISLVITDASNIAVTATAGFFVAGDVGRSLSITDFGGAGITQELKITAYTDSTHVTCSTRAGVWLPGFTPGTGPFSSAGVHATDVSTLTNQITKFNTYDTNATNYNACLNDSSNSRWNLQRVFLSAYVTGSPWNINELGWSNGNASNYVFGKVNLSSPDVVAVGKKYRVTLNFYTAYSPIDIASQSVNWGGTIGTYDFQIRNEIIVKDDGSSSNNPQHWLRPTAQTAGNTLVPRWWTSAFTMQAIKWDGDTGFNAGAHGIAAGNSSAGTFYDSTYTNGTFTKQRTAKWDDTISISAATGLSVGLNTFTTHGGLITLKPNSGTVTKPAGYWCAITSQLYWTRDLTN